MKPFLFYLLSLIFATAIAGAAPARPNVILIFIDDMGYGDVGFNGATGPKTPNLDQMVAEGMKFTDFYVGCAVCSGSRTALLTGCHYQRLSMNAVLFPNSERGLHPDEVTLADIGETRNLASENPEVVSRLQAAYDSHVAEISANRRPTAEMNRPENVPSSDRPGQPKKKNKSKDKA